MNKTAATLSIIALTAAAALTGCSVEGEPEAAPATITETATPAPVEPEVIEVTPNPASSLSTPAARASSLRQSSWT